MCVHGCRLTGKMTGACNLGTTTWALPLCYHTYLVKCDNTRLLYMWVGAGGEWMARMMMAGVWLGDARQYAALLGAQLVSYFSHH